MRYDNVVTFHMLTAGLPAIISEACTCLSHQLTLATEHHLKTQVPEQQQQQQQEQQQQQQQQQQQETSLLDRCLCIITSLLRVWINLCRCWPGRSGSAESAPILMNPLLGPTVTPVAHLAATVLLCHQQAQAAAAAAAASSSRPGAQPAARLAARKSSTKKRTSDSSSKTQEKPAAAAAADTWANCVDNSLQAAQDIAAAMLRENIGHELADGSSPAAAAGTAAAGSSRR